MFCLVDYFGDQIVTSASTGITKVVNNVPSAFLDKVVYANNVTWNDRRRIPRLEPKMSAMMMDLLEKVSDPGDLLLDAFVDTLSEHCLLLFKQTRILGYKKNGCV